MSRDPLPQRIWCDLIALSLDLSGVEQRFADALRQAGFGSGHAEKRDPDVKEWLVAYA